MEGDFQKDAEEQYGPMVHGQKIIARIKGPPKADFHGGESAARTNRVLDHTLEDVIRFRDRLLSLKKSQMCIICIRITTFS